MFSCLRDLFRAQRLDARQRLAFHPFEEGAAGGRDIGEFVGDAGRVERRDRVAAAGDRLQLAVAWSGTPRVLAICIGRRVERRHLEGAERAVPDQRLGARRAPPRPRRPTSARRRGSSRRRRRDRRRRSAHGACALNSLATTASTGSRISQLAASAAARISRAVSARSFSHSDLPTALPCAARKVLAMPPPMTSMSTFLTRLPSSSSLVETLAPPTIAATGRVGIAERLRQRLQLRLHRAAGVGRQLVGEALGRGVGAVGGGEGVVDVDVAELGELVDEGRVVLFLRLVEAGVLEQQDVAVLHRGDRLRRPVADAVGGEGDRPLDHVRRPPRRPGLQRIAGVGLALRAGRNGRAG